MNNDTKKSALPSLIGDVLSDSSYYIDNLFANTWKSLKFNQLIKTAGLTKRSGIQITEAVFLLLLWKWLSHSSIALFSRKALETFSEAKKDVMYDLLKREDADWRALNRQTSRAIYRAHKLEQSRIKAFVLDDSIKERRGKKMEGVSSHYDHVTNRHVRGQQVLTLGLATQDAFLPLDSQIYISKATPSPLIRPYRDEQSVVAKRYKEAETCDKPDIAVSMIKAAQRAGLIADYLVADAWFGTKRMIRSASELNICPILRMKKNKMKYRVNIRGKDKLLDAEGLYKQIVKRNWQKVRGLPWKAFPLEVELNLSEKPQKSPKWVKVKLLFVRGLNENAESDVGKKSWALFLTTDLKISMTKLLETYALRWGIEVYFKEAKQYLGFLAEQTWSFASHTASIHLCAIRYLMLMQVKLENRASQVGEIRDQIRDQLDMLSFAGSLWEVFRLMISGALHELKKVLGCCVETVLQAVDEKVNDFFAKSLQLDEFTLQLEYD